MQSSPAPDVEIPVVTLSKALFEKADTCGHQTALIDGITGNKLTYNKLSEAVKKVASGLVRHGLQKGDTLAIFCPNCIEFPVILFGAVTTGAIVTAINTAYTVYEVTSQIHDSGATYLFTTPDLAPIGQEAAKRSKAIKEIFVLGNIPGCIPFTILLNDSGSEFPNRVSIDPVEDVAVLLYSSGTTGLPKGVMLTHYNIIGNLVQTSSPFFQRGEMENLNATEPLDAAVVLGLVPFFHSYGMVCVMISGLTRGNTVVTLPKFKPETFLGAIEKYRVTALSLVPQLIVFLAKSPLVMKYDLSSVGFIASGAAPLGKDQERKLRNRFDFTEEFRQGYGLTETSPTLTFPPPKYKPGSIGVPIPMTEIQIADVETNEVLGSNKRGELLARGLQIMKGYHQKSEATSNCIDRNGWFHTGDIGYYDEDGHFYIVDRIKELIKHKGFQIAPAELEALLLTHPGVMDAGVVGIPDERAGEIPKAYVKKKQGYSVTKQELLTLVDEHVAPFKRLSGGLEFVDELPRTLTGKIIRRELKKMALEGKSKL